MEIWKSVVGYEGIYEVSNLGRIKGLKSYSRHLSGRIIIPYHNKRINRMNVILCNKQKRKTTYLHRIVLSSFTENPENKPEVNHIDGNPLNNKLENLEWCTRSENMKHASRLGLLNGHWNKGYKSKEKIKIDEIYKNRKWKHLK